jgi:hypothetical protein
MAVKTYYTYMKQFFLLGALIFSAAVYSQKADKPCCNIIDMVKEAGTFTIRDVNTGRIALFKPDALEGAELKIGDTVGAVFNDRKITSVKGITRSYELLEAANGDSCCVILKVDSTVLDTLWKITAKNISTGEDIQFNVPRPLAMKLNAGSIVYTQPSHGYAMISAAETDTAEKKLYGFPLLQEKEK